MAGITYQDVEVAINKIIGRGEVPSIPRVREELGGTGSPNTIHKHLKAWKAAAPIVERKSIELPSELKFAIVCEIERQSASSKSEVEKALVDAEVELDILSFEGEKLEESAAELTTCNQSLSDENQRLLALSGERKGEIDKLDTELKKEREASESTRVQLAKELNKNEDLLEKHDHLSNKAGKLEMDIEAEKKAVVIAEKDLAVMQSKYDSEVDKNKTLNEQSRVIDAEVKQKDIDISAIRTDFDVRMKQKETDIKASYEKIVVDIQDAHKAALNSLEKARIEAVEQYKEQVVILQNEKKTLQEDVGKLRDSFDPREKK